MLSGDRSSKGTGSARGWQSGAFKLRVDKVLVEVEVISVVLSDLGVNAVDLWAIWLQENYKANATSYNHVGNYIAIKVKLDYIQVSM